MTGQLLVAAPQLNDPNFFRTVILILRHESDGAFGLVLNRPSDVTVADALEEVLNRRPAIESPLFWGGPVDGPLAALHLNPDLGEFAVSDLYYGTTDQEQLMALIDKPATLARYFAGYSGWGPSQLDDEFRVGSWLLAKPNYEDLFGEVEEMWETCLRRVGRDILGGILPDQDFDPTVN